MELQSRFKHVCGVLSLVKLNRFFNLKKCQICATIMHRGISIISLSTLEDVNRGSQNIFDNTQLGVLRVSPLTAKLFNPNFHPFEVVSR